ncbi:hypothetical protein NDU88_004657 [Pleurodeles waltl]|uniref:Uncharacterized protein n=1 Tax=Pleurodeles waltl TaxID=8319 RepID=A0AAV7QFV8_PLEWA|nr:hypothetical protein NDU88_004657 [Pleurodeles waltl]
MILIRVGPKLDDSVVRRGWSCQGDVQRIGADTGKLDLRGSPNSVGFQRGLTERDSLEAGSGCKKVCSGRQTKSGR